MNRLTTVTAIAMMLLTTCVTACTGDGAGHGYSGYRDLPGDGWPYGDVCVYTVESRDSVVSGTMSVSLTHDNTYEYSNLWLEVSYTDAEGTAHKDTVNVPMCDPYGNWYGDGLPGRYQLRHTTSATPVSVADGSSIAVRHIMRVDTLEGISRLGLAITR